MQPAKSNQLRSDYSIFHVHRPSSHSCCARSPPPPADRKPEVCYSFDKRFKAYRLDEHVQHPQPRRTATETTSQPSIDHINIIFQIISTGGWQADGCGPPPILQCHQPLSLCSVVSTNHFSPLGNDPDAALHWFYLSGRSSCSNLKLPWQQ